MPALAKLAPRKLASLPPGRHGDGGGLYLHVDASGARRWVFVFHHGPKGANGKAPRREMGVGPLRSVSLARAREIAAEARAEVATGRDPRVKVKPVTIPTFGAYADSWLDSVKEQWRGKKTEPRWRLALEGYAKPFRERAVNEITTEDIAAVLRPVWRAKPAMAAKVREAWERVFSAAKVSGFRDGQNPAALKENLSELLTKRPKTKRHHPSMPHADAREFYAALRGKGGNGARALELLMLTAVRTSVVLEATWEEVDLDAARWSIPAHKMKNPEQVTKPDTHFIVPLSGAALDLLERLEGTRAGLLFPSHDGEALSYNTMRAIMVKSGYVGEKAAVPHGFRTTFKVWGAERKVKALSGEPVREFAEPALEYALNHFYGDETFRAYNRLNYIDERSAAMEAWGRYLAGVSARTEREAA